MNVIVLWHLSQFPVISLYFLSLITPENGATLLSPTSTVTGGNPDAKRLYDDLLSNYNKLVRPGWFLSIFNI